MPRKLRDDTILRYILVQSTFRIDPGAYSADMFEIKLEDNICFHERAIEQLKQEIEMRKHHIDLLVRSHFEFSKAPRAFVERLCEKNRTKLDDYELHLLEEYVAGSEDSNDYEDKNSISEYLKRVRESCSERKPWLLRPAIEPELIEAATVEGEVESW